MNILDAYYKTNLHYAYDDYHLEFKVSQELFSSQVVDHGTQRLLRTLIFEKINSFVKALDLGCGYGPIGIVLKKICPQSQVHMVDRDALALGYAQENVQLNGVEENVFVYGSLGYDSVRDKNFDLIVSNIPAKVGEHVLTHMIKDARFYLKENGKVIIVVIDAIAEFIHRELTTDENIDILYHRSWPGHHVYHYRFNSSADSFEPQQDGAFERGEYARQKNNFDFKGKRFTLETTFHLPEFDNLSYDTSLLLSFLEKIKKPVKNSMIFHPNQGYIPVVVASEFQPESVCLIDRDLQALKVSQVNVRNQGFPKDQIFTFHQVGLQVSDKQFDLIIGTLPEQQNREVYMLFLEQIARQLTEEGMCVLASSSTVITRIEEILSQLKSFQVLKRKRENGRSIIQLLKTK